MSSCVAGQSLLPQHQALGLKAGEKRQGWIVALALALLEGYTGDC